MYLLSIQFYQVTVLVGGIASGYGYEIARQHVEDQANEIWLCRHETLEKRVRHLDAFIAGLDRDEYRQVPFEKFSDQTLQRNVGFHVQVLNAQDDHVKYPLSQVHQVRLGGLLGRESHFIDQNS